MISVDQAREYIANQIELQADESIDLADALERILAISVDCTSDSPPHDKSLMDGYAVSADSYQRGKRLRVVEQVVAGQVPSFPIDSETATRIMTGAPIPTGATCVVMVELSQIESIGEDEFVTLDAEHVTAGQNILPRGRVMRAGETVIDRATTISPAVIGLLAEIGCPQVNVYRQPRVAILSTGNELVDHWQQPGPGCIRNSNGPMIAASVRRAGGEPVELGIATDDEASLRAAVKEGLKCDVLVMSGGVSAGVLDLTPQVLASCGVEEIFHKVNLKPGKPLWFGKANNTETNKPTLVFGLPGNPVSGFVCFELFVRYAMWAMTGQGSGYWQPRTARLSQPFQQEGRRDTYYPCRFIDDRGTIVEPLGWKGSADLRTIAQANGLIFFLGETRLYELDSEVTVYPL
ncbi:MAG: molybdopterin molybdotransferase [Pirellulaceae bacterium]|jgi:molybdopterin molybdotransferase